MPTNHGAACSICLLLLLVGLSYGLDHWNLSVELYASHGNFEIDTENRKIIVTVTNSMYHLDMDLTSPSNVITVEAEQSDFSACLNDFRPNQECQNYPRVLVLPEGEWPITADNGTVWNTSDTVLSCGSNAFSPRCYYRRKTDLQLLTSHSSSHFNPFGPFNWVPGIWTTTGRLIVATPFNDLFTRVGITMSHAPFDGGIQATTRTNQKLWFNKTPNFVSMYEIGDYIYVFYREEAVEISERVIYSRVARICKNDMGALLEETTTFTTYLKARISCSISERANGVAYHYNDLYDTHYIPEEQRLYAVFRSPRHGPLGSVVCSYTFGTVSNDLDTVFSSDYRVEEGRGRFVVRRNFDPFTCSEGRSQEDAFYVLMAPTVTTHPTLMLEGHAFQRIVSDRIDDQNEVLFITSTRESDNALVLLKVSVTTTGRNAPTYHIINTTVLPTTPNSAPTVTKMEIYDSGPSAYLYIGTETDIYRVPTQDCASYSTCCQCVAARDPYCAFDAAASEPSGSCVAVGVADSSRDLRQDLTNGDTGVCVISAASSSVSDETQSGTSDAETTPSKPMCSGGVTPPGGGGGSVTEGATFATGPGIVTELGIGVKQTAIQGYRVWIIVGTVAGFIGGVVFGIIMVMICKHRFGRRNKTSDLVHPHAITNDTTATPSRNKKGSVAPSGQLKDEILRINNSTSEFTTSNNFTRSSNDYTRHIPAHLKEPQTPVKCPQTPVKYPQTPIKYPDGTPKKCVATSTPPAEFSPPPKGKCQPSVFTFSHSSIHTPPHSHAKSSPYCSSMAGASASSTSSDGSYQEPGGGGGKPTHTNPNLQLNYKARVYLTNSQRENYGPNILARMPSIDGSKSKYTGIVEMPGRVSSSGSTAYASDSLPRHAGYRTQHDIVQLDTELGCSQC